MADAIPRLTQYTVALASRRWARSYANRHMFQALSIFFDFWGRCS